MAKKTWEETWGALESGSFWKEDVSLDAIQDLLDAGADINAQNKYGSTPLHRAVEIDRMDIVDFLLERGCEPSLNEALRRAADCGRVQIVERLLKAGADPNYESNRRGEQESVLASAYDCQWPDERRKIVELLLRHGAVPTKRDIHVFRYCHDELVHHMLENPDLYWPKKEDLAGNDVKEDLAGNDVMDWIREHPDPTVQDFLAPMKSREENVITSLVRAGSRALEMAFPLQKWARLECIEDLHTIFATVPKEKNLMKTMMDLDDKLRTTYNFNQWRRERQQERQRRNDLADMLLAIDDPTLRRQMDEKMRQKWGLRKRSVLKKDKER